MERHTRGVERGLANTLSFAGRMRGIRLVRFLLFFPVTVGDRTQTNDGRGSGIADAGIAVGKAGFDFGLQRRIFALGDCLDGGGAYDPILVVRRLDQGRRGRWIGIMREETRGHCPDRAWILLVHRAVSLPADARKRDKTNPLREANFASSFGLWRVSSCWAIRPSLDFRAPVSTSK